MMAGRTQPALAHAPDWMAAEMPPGYRTRLLEIERLSADLQGMDDIGRVLWETGEPLKEAVGAVFGELKCRLDATPGATTLTVLLDDARRLLVVVSCAEPPLQRTHEELARTFQAVQFAEAGDRVVLVTGNDPATPPADRADPVLPDALGMLERMGANVLPTATLFKLWRLSLEDQQKARKAVDRLHAQDGGLFLLQPR